MNKTVKNLVFLRKSLKQNNKLKAFIRLNAFSFTVKFY